MSNLKTYRKHPIKEVNGIRQYDDKDQPILAESTKNVRLDVPTAATLNANASSFGAVYILVEDTEKNVSEDEKSANDTELDVLRQEAKELGVQGAHLIKDKEKLIAKINEKKK
jgi:hypothetical protein